MNPHQLKNLLLQCVLLLSTSLYCAASASAQDAPGAPERQAPPIEGKIVDNLKNAIPNAEISLVLYCPCEPCTSEGRPCRECCPPGVVATTKTDASGSFTLPRSVAFTPGKYVLMVKSGRFSRDVEVKVYESFKIDIVEKAGVKAKFSDAFTMVNIPLATMPR